MSCNYRPETHQHYSTQCKERKDYARIHHIGMCNRRLLGDIVNTQLIVRIHQQVHDRLRPIRTVAQQAQIAQWLFGATEFPFFLAELVRELDEEFSKAVALMLGKSENTGDVVVFSGFLFFREIADDMCAR